MHGQAEVQPTITVECAYDPHAVTAAFRLLLELAVRRRQRLAAAERVA